MKKIYAILVAAVMSVSLFADPTQADLQSYMAEGYYVACFQAPAGATCNDIYWMGSYVDWNISTPLDELVKCEELAGYAGWYVAKVPVVEGKANDGKPIQLNECGKMTWDVQPGTAAPTELVAGTVTIIEMGAECDLRGWSATDPAIIKIGSWKNGYNPCEMVCEAQSYTIRIYPPYCEFLSELEPTIRGSFNHWGDAITMEFKGTYFEYVSEPVTAEFEFKFNNDANGSWDHQFEAYDAENDTWGNVPAEGNLSLNNGTEFYEYDEKNRVLTFNFSDDELYRYKGCEEQEEVDSTKYYTIVAINAPAGAPESGVEIIGTFDEWQGTAMEKLNTGWYFVELEVIGADKFKFREAGTWDNEIVYVGKISKDGKPVGLEDFRFDALWKDDTYKGMACKWIELDLSDANQYVWRTDWVAPEDNDAKYIVTFVDYDGRIISQQFVPQGGSASAPNDPYREGYLFAGWDKEFSNVTSDLTITAKYDYGFKLIDGINYYLKSSDSTALVVNGGNYSGNIVIPENVNYDNISFKVIAINLQAFYNCDGLKSIVIPASVTYIGEEAFYYCGSLKSITMLSETPAIIESNTFGYYYDTQKVIYVPCGTMDTYQNAWSNYSEQIRYLPKTYDYTLKAEANDRNMGYVQLPSSACDEDLLTAMPYKGYHFVRWSDGVTANPRPFVLTKDTMFTAEFALDLSGKCGQDSALTWIYEPENQTLTISGNGALTNNYTYRTAAQKYAKNIIVQKGITAIGYEAFSYCDSLQSIAILNGNASLEENILYRSLNVQNIETPAGIFAGPEYYYLPGFTYEVNIDFTHKLQTVKINGGKMWDEYFTLLGNSQKTLQTLDLSAAEMESFPESALADYRQLSTIVLPYGLKNISYAMAANCYYLQAILIPAGVTEIDDRAFDNCRSLASVEFAGNAVKRIGDWSFYNCHELANIVIPEGVTEIGKAAFYGCAYAKAAHLPASLQSIGDNGFAGCSKMAQMIVDAVVPPTVGLETFDEVSTEAPVYVPEESVEAYQSHPVWGKLNIVGDNAPQGIEDVQTNGQFTKVLRDGQIVILHGDKIYTLTGQEVK